MNWKILSVVLFFATAVSIFSIKVWQEDARASFRGSSELQSIQIAGKTIRVSVANTPDARARGLGGVNMLASGEGMLFVFDTDSRYQFWMKDMLFSIDILWLSSYGRVVDMRENASPMTYPEVFTPNVPARYVLELPAGFARDNNVNVGDIVGL
ncbi:MAG: DUF192 domain-containing protein [Candidatus Kaiserbacteria bacterium]|nr:DUF192 domain-containing protein [Candidatus Kaiserbacteria bacterium]